MFHHIFHLHIFYAIALGIGSKIFHIATMTAFFFIFFLFCGFSVFQIMLQKSMDHYVWITTDGGSEMRIIIKGQSVMPNIVSGVKGLAHTSDGQSVNKILFFFSMDIL